MITSRVSTGITAARGIGAIKNTGGHRFATPKSSTECEFKAGEARMNAAWEWNDINEQKAKRRFGIKHYRAGQRKLIQAVL